MKQPIGCQPDLIRAMEKAGIVPDNCRRIVIDINYDGAVCMYYEVFADDRIIDLDLPKRLAECLNIKEGEK